MSRHAAAESTRPAVTATAVRKQYGDTVAVRDVSLDVHNGEVFGLIGPNGAGKSTLIGLLTGTRTPTEGSIRVFGESPIAVDRSRLSVLPQEFSPHRRLTGRELVSYYAGLYPDPRPVDEVLDRVGLDDEDAATAYTDLSGGQQRRVCVGAALVNDPELLFLDEPTTGIDPAGRRDVWDLVDSLADDGTAVVLTTHYMAEAERLADRVGLLTDGELVRVGPPRDLVERFGGETRLAVRTECPRALDLDATPLDGRRYGDYEYRFFDAGLDDLTAMLDHLDAADIAYEEVSLVHPTLEDVYLNLASERGHDCIASAGPAGVAGDAGVTR
ncbi:ABC transporter ATP-binding protein [Haloferax volcanii]|uniref:ABC transporter ATP-binding protein n=1 Tax=Haloferax volcanii TaxID=2246 RepID=UPI00349FA07A